MITEVNCFLGEQTLKKGTGTFDSLHLWLYSKRHIAIVLITVFSLLSIFGNDFLYEKKGRYFYSVLVSADAELF
ncbi:MAG: hypothetical protein O7D34_04010, partial [Ignavibacteria bacterium]|nr:hypothetical protein [Ignavibacteria bacterium]